jgi:ABC-type polar amino acid transport system ATPase subunit
MTSVVVTHEMAFARRVADRVVFMESGRVIDDAPTAEFFRGTSSERAKRFLDQILHH